MENIKIFACRSAENFTKEICDYLKLPMGEMEILKFKNDSKNIRTKTIVVKIKLFLELSLKLFTFLIKDGTPPIIKPINNSIVGK